MKKLIVIIIMVPLLTASASADFNITDELCNREELTSGLDENEKFIAGTITESGTYVGDGYLNRLLDKYGKLLKEQFTAYLSEGCRLFALSLAASLACAISDNKKSLEYINFAACICCAVFAAGNTDSCISSAVDTIRRLSDYSKAALPVICTAAAVGGNAASSAAKYAVCCMGMNIILYAAENIIIPMVSSYIAVCICASVCEMPQLRAIARFIKWSVMTMLSLLTLSFSLYMSFTGIITGSADAAAVKTAKTVLSVTIPVVGGMISDAASVVLGAAALIRNSAGAFGTAAAAAICFCPFLLLLFRMIILKLTSAAADLLPELKIAALLNDISGAYAMLVGLTGAAAIIVFVSFTAMMKAVIV